MSLQKRSDLQSLYGSSGSKFPDNTSGLITPLIERGFGQDLTDSHFNLTDDAYTGAKGVYLGAVTDTTGLKAVVTVNVQVGAIVIFFDGSLGVNVYKLFSGTDAESLPGVVRPSDYNASTNAKVWKLGGGPGISGGAGGDLSGTYPNPTVSKIKGNTVPINAEGVLQNDGAGNLSWVPSSVGSILNGIANISGSAYSSTIGISSYTGFIGIIHFHTPNSGPCTLNIDGLGDVPLTYNCRPLKSGDIISPQSFWVIYNSITSGFDIIGPIEDFSFLSVLTGKTQRQSAVAMTTTALPSNSYGSGIITASINGNFNTQTGGIDGCTFYGYEYIVINNESSTYKNGVYQLTSLGGVSSKWQLVRVSDQDTAAEINDCLIYIKQGTANGKKFFKQTQTVTTVGTDPISFSEYSHSDLISNITSSISIGGDLSGTLPNPTVAKIKGNTIPSDANGYLFNNGSGSLSWASVSSGPSTSGAFPLRGNGSGGFTNLVWPSDGQLIMKVAGPDYADSGVSSDGHNISVDGSVQVKSYTVATVPSASPAAKMIYVSNESGGAVLAFSDGTNWRRVTDRAIIS